MECQKGLQLYVNKRGQVSATSYHFTEETDRMERSRGSRSDFSIARTYIMIAI